MVKSPTALIAERRQIAAIIRSDSVDVVLMRRPKIPTPDNSYKWGPAVPVYKASTPDNPNQPQKGALIPFKRRLVDMLINTELGEVEKVPYTLVLPHDADIQRDDRFTLEGKEWVVRWIDIKHQVRITAGVDYLGGDPHA
jgi:hypothetical protein